MSCVSREFELSSEFQEYELPSAPDLGAMVGQQSAPVQLPSIPATPVDDDVPPAPDFDWMMDYMGSSEDDNPPDSD